MPVCCLFVLWEIECAGLLSLSGSFWRILGRFEADAAAGWVWGVDEFADGFHQGLDVGVVGFEAVLYFGQLGENFLVSDEGAAHADEGLHDEDAHFDGAVGIEYRGGHDDAVFGEGVGEISRAAVRGT